MSGRVVRLNEDEDIYIDCNPVTTEGEEITDDNNEIKPELVNNQILDDLTNNIVGGELFNNIGIQTIIGVVVFAVLYGLGNYVFKDVPKNIIQKKLPQEMQ
tara:strand:- start:271 stop:573 length:303 start_codon:yes stop_codon:yes gene_type:complete